MITQHIKDRFFQRYGDELTVETLREIIGLAIKAKGEPEHVAGQERVEVVLRGKAILFVWNRDKRFILTFLPPRDPALWVALPAPRRKRRR